MRNDGELLYREGRGATKACVCVCVCRGLGHGVKGVRGNSSGNSYYADDY